MEGSEVPIAIEVPNRITEEWIKTALEVGIITNGRRTFFVKTYPENSQERTLLVDTYGFPVPGKSGKGYFYHGTKIEDLPGIANHGVFADARNPNIAASLGNEAAYTARIRESKLNLGIVAVAKGPWDLVDIPVSPIIEGTGVPGQKFQGSREELPIPDYLKKVTDLRILPEENILGFYLIKQ